MESVKQKELLIESSFFFVKIFAEGIDFLNKKI